MMDGPKLLVEPCRTAEFFNKNIILFNPQVNATILPYLKVAA
tara:strand:- start:763 stop:888 length:126 start_codon:yes stop_codon:yes gene_type:complete